MYLNAGAFGHMKSDIDFGLNPLSYILSQGRLTVAVQVIGSGTNYIGDYIWVHI